MRRLRSYSVALVLIAILTVVALIISTTLFTTTTMTYIIIMGAALAGILAFLSGLNDVVELVSRISESKKDELNGVSSDSQASGRENVAIEYRIAVLEGTLEWLLENSVVVKSLSEEETEAIHKGAIERVRKRFPQAQIGFEKEDKQ